MEKQYSTKARIRLEKELDKIDAEIERLENIGGEENIVENRLYLLSTIIESYCSWNEHGDCLPDRIKLGRFGNKWIKIEVLEE